MDELRCAYRRFVMWRVVQIVLGVSMGMVLTLRSNMTYGILLMVVAIAGPTAAMLIVWRHFLRTKRAMATVEPDQQG